MVSKSVKPAGSPLGFGPCDCLKLRAALPRKGNTLFGSVVLEVTLGLVFVYAWFGLACSAIVEFLESFRAQRGKLLAHAIERMLGAELRLKFYEHGLVRSMSKSNRLPSYLPWRVFATVDSRLAGVSTAQFRQQLAGIPGEVGVDIARVDQHRESYEEVALAIEQWFESAMDRCSGWVSSQGKAHRHS